MHELVLTFFVQGDEEKRGDMLRQCHMDVYNIEHDMMCITPEGSSAVFEKSEYLDLLRQSKAMADGFSQIQLQLGMSEIEYLRDAMERLRKMLQVMDVFESTQSHRLVENQEHVRRLFDLVMGSTCFEVFQLVLQQPDTLNEPVTALLKMEALKSVIYITLGAKYLSSMRGLQSNYSR